MSRLLALLGCGWLLSLTGCRCNQPTDKSSFGEIAFVFDQGGTTLTAPDGTYDFGKVGMGTSKQLTVTVQNRGTGPLDLDSVAKTDGENLRLGTTLDEEPPVFQLAFTAITVGAGQSQDFMAEFDAPLESDPSVKTKDHVADLVLHASNTAAGMDTATLTFKGTAVSGSCSLPQTLDFGAVAIGDTLKLSIPLQNVSPLDATATIGVITSNSGDDKDFGFAPESAQGTVSIVSGATRNVVVEFAPTQGKDYLALVHVKASDQCPDVTVTLLGTGVEQVLTCAPNPLDFGYVTPGLTAAGQVVLSNEGIAPLTLTGLGAVVGAAPSTEYQLVGASSVTVPPAVRMTQNGVSTLVPGTATVQLTFSPSLLGPREGALTAATPLAQQPMLSCPLIGRGGGPDIDVSPKSLAAGQVPFFATAPAPFFVSRKVTVQNLGTAPSPPDAKGNLHLGKPNATGAYVKPYWKITANNAQSTDDELCVGLYDDVNFPAQPCRNDLAPSYDPMVGIVASGVHALLDIPVRITPNGPNLSLDWTISFYSNDPDEAQVDVHVTAQSVVLPPCQYSSTPALLNFGLVSPPGYRDLSVAITNLGTNPGDVCLITNLDLEPGADPVFTLPAGPITQQQLMPGQTVNVTVRAWPQGQVGQLLQPATGALQFGMSSPTTPSKEIQLTAQIATGCLTIAPDDLDFGTVQKGCGSAKRTFSVYNTCPQAVTVNSWGMLSAAGEPGGGPDCAGPGACPEFLIDGTPSFVMGTVLPAGSATPGTFTLKYHPINYGPDTGAFDLNVTQNGQAVDYIVTLRGNGDTTGLNTDVFQQDSKPKADILLVIDNSCSMSDKQTQLSMNFASFIAYAQAANVDYHLGVVVTDLDATATEGDLLGDPTNPKVLTPATPNVESLFKTKVVVGINGGTEGTAGPAVKALTAPLITGVNAGFLRLDAVLAVVGVSDAGDQSPLPATVYENQLRNIKGAQRANMFTFNRIGPFSASPPAGCSYDDFTDTSVDEYLVQQFNGVKEQICTQNWAAALENLGKTAFGYRTNFYLTAAPDLTGGKVITVTLSTGNGTPIPLPQTDSHGSPIWTYDATSNSLDFEPLYVPEPGTTLTVTYNVPCL